MAEAADLKSAQYGFESHSGYAVKLGCATTNEGIVGDDDNVNEQEMIEIVVELPQQEEVYDLVKHHPVVDGPKNITLEQFLVDVANTLGAGVASLQDEIGRKHTHCIQQKLSLLAMYCQRAANEVEMSTLSLVDHLIIEAKNAANERLADE